MSLAIEEASLRGLADAAREFSKLTPRKNPSGSYARALSRLVDAARVYAAKSDEQWAAEVVEARSKVSE